jgi:SNF2 family DNA or RNA helicase
VVWLINILQLAEKIKKYCIHPSNIYNFDEKEFLLGICCMMKRIVSIYQLHLKKLLSSNQDEICKFISLLACICADRMMLPPTLIYQADLYNLQDSWLEDFDSSSEEAYFAVSKKR